MHRNVDFEFLTDIVLNPNFTQFFEQIIKVSMTLVGFPEPTSWIYIPRRLEAHNRRGGSPANLKF